MTAKIPTEEAAQVLRNVIDRKVTVEYIDNGDLNRTWRTSDGWTFSIFDDSGGMDYLNSITAPDGRHSEFDDWIIDTEDVYSINNPLDSPSINDTQLAEVLKWEEVSDYH